MSEEVIHHYIPQCVICQHENDDNNNNSLHQLTCCRACYIHESCLKALIDEAERPRCPTCRANISMETKEIDILIEDNRDYINEEHKLRFHLAINFMGNLLLYLMIIYLSFTIYSLSSTKREIYMKNYDSKMEEYTKKLDTINNRILELNNEMNDIVSEKSTLMDNIDFLDTKFKNIENITNDNFFEMVKVQKNKIDELNEMFNKKHTEKASNEREIKTIRKNKEKLTEDMPEDINKNPDWFGYLLVSVISNLAQGSYWLLAFCDSPMFTTDENRSINGFKPWGVSVGKGILIYRPLYLPCFMKKRKNTYDTWVFIIYMNSLIYCIVPSVIYIYLLEYAEYTNMSGIDFLICSILYKCIYMITILYCGDACIKHTFKRENVRFINVRNRADPLEII